MGNAVGVSGEEKGPFISVALMRALIDKYEAVKRSDAGLCDEDMYSILCEEASIRMGTSISPSSGDRDPTCRNPSAESDKICAVTPPSSRDGSDKLTVLVVDDSPLACKLALRVLRMGGHHADAVLTGNEGVSTLRNFPGKYDLVLLDIVMPEMDGIEVLSRIKAIPALVKVPVVMLSGLEDQTLAETCLHQGASAVLLKPLNPESVANVIGKQIMNKKKGSRVVAGGGVMPTLVPEDLHPVSVGSPAPELALVDAHQQAFTLDQVKKGKPIVLLFLPQGRDHNTGAAGALIGELAGSLREFKACHAEVCAVGQARVLPVVAQLGIRPLRDPDLGAFSRYMRAGERSVQTGLDVLGVIALNGDRTVVFSWGSTVIEQDVAKGVFVPRAEKILSALNAGMGQKYGDSHVTDSSPLQNCSRAEVPPTSSSRHSISILVVDDSNVSSKLAVRKLMALGHDTSHADSGQTALQMLRQRNQYDLVLLDIVMPTMDGVEVLTTMQSDKNLVDIPVAMLSGLEDEMLANVCLESGAIAVLQKPLDTAEVQELIMSKGITRRRTTSRR